VFVDSKLRVVNIGQLSRLVPQAKPKNSKSPRPTDAVARFAAEYN
jgi:hypothetical protein